MGQCNNQPNDGFPGGGGIVEETRMGRMYGGGRLLVILGGRIQQQKIKIERAMGPSVWMASSGCGNATTNQKSATTIGYS